MDNTYSCVYILKESLFFVIDIFVDMVAKKILKACRYS